MDPLTIAKLATGFVVSAGTGTIVKNIIKSTTPDNLKIAKRVTVVIGGFVLSGMVGEMATKYTDKNIDGIVKGFKTGVNLAKKKEPVIPTDESVVTDN